MRSPFPMVLAKWSLVFRSFGTSLRILKTALSLVYDNNVISVKIVGYMSLRIVHIRYRQASLLVPTCVLLVLDTA